jgi:AcrR family transcriptional regulator
MSPRKPAVLRDGDGPGLREYLIATAARLIAERGTAGLAVRDIAREARVADGVLYNYFEDKEDLLTHALLAHVGAVMNAATRTPVPGTGTVADNLRQFIEAGFDVLSRVAPAFAGLLSQPKVLGRFHATVGGDTAFVAADSAADSPADGAADAPAEPVPAPEPGEPEPAGRGLPALLTGYLLAEQRLGRVDPAADVGAAVALIIGTIHGEILPRVMFAPPGTQIAVAPGLADRVARTIMRGIAPGAPGAPGPPGAPGALR